MTDKHAAINVGDFVLFTDGGVGEITTALGVLHANESPAAHGIVRHACGKRVDALIDSRCALPPGHDQKCDSGRTVTDVTPPQLSLIRRPFNIQEIAEFVHHLGADVEFVATDTNDDVYGGITRLQMIELLKLVPIPPCKICGENHGAPLPASIAVTDENGTVGDAKPKTYPEWVEREFHFNGHPAIGQAMLLISERVWECAEDAGFEKGFEYGRLSGEAAVHVRRFQGTSQRADTEP